MLGTGAFFTWIEESEVAFKGLGLLGRRVWVLRRVLFRVRTGFCTAPCRICFAGVHKRFIGLNDVFSRFLGDPKVSVLRGSWDLVIRVIIKVTIRRGLQSLVSASDPRSAS